MDTPHTYPYPLAYAIIMGQYGRNTTPEGYDSDRVCYRAYALARAEYHLAIGGFPPGEEMDWASWVNLPSHPEPTGRRILNFLRLAANLPDPSNDLLEV